MAELQPGPGERGGGGGEAEEALPQPTAIVELPKPWPWKAMSRGGLPSCQVRLDEDGGVGEYVVLSKAVVSREPKFGGEHDVVAKVQVGARVKVLEVCVSDEDKRIRGRLKKPPGWISLVNTATGRRWAAKMVLCRQRHALQRLCAERRGACSLCGRTYIRGALLLSCEYCAYDMCMRCLSNKAPLQAWSFNATADIQVNALGLQLSVAPPMRVLVQNVVFGSWAERVGVRAFDELVAINGVAIDQVTPRELEGVLARTRPLEFTFVYNGPDLTNTHSCATPCRTPRAVAAAGTSESVAVLVFVQNVDFSLLCADTQLFASFKSIIRHSVVDEAGHGVLREHVELAFSAGHTLMVRCVVGPLQEAVAADVREQLINSATLGAAVTLGLNRLPKIKSVGFGPICVVGVEVEPEKERTGRATPRSPAWPHFIATRAFLRHFNGKQSLSPPRTKEVKGLKPFAPLSPYAAGCHMDAL